MFKTACLLNTSELGGAERSFLTQLGLLDSPKKFDLYYPRVLKRSASIELVSFARVNGFEKIKGFDYNEDLYEMSRSSGTFNIFNVLLGLFNQILILKVDGLFRYKNIWCNGNKVFLPIFLGALFYGFEGKVIWHLRDYPHGQRFNAVIRFLYRRFAKFNLVLVGNSTSVVHSYKQAFTKELVLRVYNPVLKSNSDDKNKPRTKTIGFAGMSVPWKGLHELYLWASLYEKELKDLGIQKIAVFGKNIYMTKGEHTEYDKELEQLRGLFESSLIDHRGLVSPSEIYSSIDIMLHLSTRPEPFGRVILESFSKKVPCISTGLGGAKELMSNNPSLIHFSNDFHGLFEKVQRLCTSEEFYQEQVDSGLVSYHKIQEQAYLDLFKLETLCF